MNLKNWSVLPLHKDQAAEIAARFGLPSVIAMLLQVRGVHTDAQITALLSATAAPLSDPFLMKDMDKAVQRIQQGIDAFEKIAVYGDYDADGITATAILYTYLQSVGADVMYYIPQREGEGYGMNCAAVKTLADSGVNLIITVDNGISCGEEVAFATSLGVDVVITDHHRPQAVLPKAIAVVDPHRADCNAPFQDFCGAGIALKLVMALEVGTSEAEDILYAYADLAALGTIADVVPLWGENRSIVKYGLERLAESEREGIRTLSEKAALTAPTATAVAFTLVPRINATGRMGAPDRAVELLTTEYHEDAVVLADDICKDNEARRATEAEITQQALRKIESDDSLKYSRVLVVAGEDWHPGVLGIVAARLMERYGRPVVVISKTGEQATGSGRSFEGFSLFEAVSACSAVLERFGGHPLAAGLSLQSAQIPAFREAVNAYAQKVAPQMPAPKVIIDLKLLPRALSVQIPHQLQALEPFGSGNAAPVFGLFGMTLREITPVGGGNHLRLGFQRENTPVNCMKFGCTVEDFPYQIGAVLDLAVTLEAREFRGAESLTVLLREMRPAGLDSEATIVSWRCYEKYCRAEELTQAQAENITPERSEIADVYRLLRTQGGWKLGLLQLQALLPNRSVSLGKLRVMLDILAERKLITLQGEERPVIALLEVEGKTDLFASAVYKKLRALTKEG